HRTPPRAAARRAAKLALAVRDRSPAEGLRRSGRCPRRAARTLVELLLGFGGRLLRGRSGLGLFLRGTLLLLLVELDLQAPGRVHVPIVVVFRPLAAGPQLVRILHRTRVARFETHGFELLHTIHHFEAIAIVRQKQGVNRVRIAAVLPGESRARLFGDLLLNLLGSSAAARSRR